MSEPVTAEVCCRHHEALGCWPAYSLTDALAPDVVVIGPRDAPGSIVMPRAPAAAWRQHHGAAARAEVEARRAARDAARRAEWAAGAADAKVRLAEMAAEAR